MDENSNNEPKKTGTPPREVLYNEAAKHTQRAIEVLVEIMNNGDNDNARMGAAKAILAKSIPDLKAVELSGPDGSAIQLKYVIDLAGGYIPPLGAINASPADSSTGSTQIQGTGLAQESQKDNDSPNGTSEAGAV